MNSYLELAKRALPDRELVQLNDRDVWAVEDYPGGIRRDAIAFDPLGKHFPDVLAWLACQTDVHITDGCVATQRSIHDYAAGTADGLAQAVYEAAIRIVED